jgi:GT2 family glycosyltransferase
MRYAAVILHYRNWPGVCDAIEAVEAQTSQPHALIVVDNCSADGSAQALRERRPAVTVIEADRNGGYASGMNIGAAAAIAAGVDAVLFLTHDCVLSRDAAQAMLETIERDRVGIVGPQIYFRTDPSAGFSSGGFVTDRGKIGHWPIDPAGCSDREADWIDGCAMLVRSEVWRVLGGFDDGYFMYFEETEFCLRTRRLGWSVLCTGRARAWQQPGGRPLDLWVRNQLRFTWRNATRTAFFTTLLGVVRSIAGNLRHGIETERRERVRAQLRGVAWFAAGRSYSPREGVPTANS